MNIVKRHQVRRHHEHHSYHFPSPHSFSRELLQTLLVHYPAADEGTGHLWLCNSISRGSANETCGCWKYSWWAYQGLFLSWCTSTRGRTSHLNYLLNCTRCNTFNPFVLHHIIHVVGNGKVKVDPLKVHAVEIFYNHRWRNIYGILPQVHQRLCQNYYPIVRFDEEVTFRQDPM